jgi:hypothetical protein
VWLNVTVIRVPAELVAADWNSGGVFTVTALGTLLVACTAFASTIVRFTVYDPTALYVCIGGFCRFEVVPSPKSHVQPEIPVPVEVSWKLAYNGNEPLVFVIVKSATGAAPRRSGRVMVLVRKVTSVLVKALPFNFAFAPNAMVEVAGPPRMFPLKTELVPSVVPVLICQYTFFA